MIIRVIQFFVVVNIPHHDQSSHRQTATSDRHRPPTWRALPDGLGLAQSRGTRCHPSGRQVVHDRSSPDGIRLSGKRRPASGPIFSLFRRIRTANQSRVPAATGNQTTAPEIITKQIRPRQQSATQGSSSWLKQGRRRSLMNALSMDAILRLRLAAFAKSTTDNAMRQFEAAKLPGLLWKKGESRFPKKRLAEK